MYTRSFSRVFHLFNHLTPASKVRRLLGTPLIFEIIQLKSKGHSLSQNERRDIFEVKTFVTRKTKYEVQCAMRCMFNATLEVLVLKYDLCYSNISVI